MGHESSNFLGGLALMSTFVSLTLCSRSYLPSSQMKILDELLQETRQIYDKSVSEESNSKLHLGERLTHHERLREQVRERCYQAITIFDQYIALVRGISAGIMNVTELAKELRAQVVTTSAQTKRRREESGSNPARDATPNPAPLATMIESLTAQPAETLDYAENDDSVEPSEIVSIEVVAT